MKKILLCIILLFCMSTSVHAKEAIRVKKELTDVYSTKTSIEGKTFTAQLYYLYVEDKIAYCIEPGVLLQDHDYTSSNDFSNLGVDEKTKKEIELIAHYGYGYKEHNTLEYYMATQALIWEKIGATNISYMRNGVALDIETHKQKIENLTQSHTELPSFASKEYRIKVGNSLTLEDENRVIDRFKFTKGDGKIEGNRVVISHNMEESIDYTFASKARNETSLVYFSPSSQKVAIFSLSSNNMKTFGIKVTYYQARGKIVLKKVDTISKEGLLGASFDLYDAEDHLVQTGTTDVEGNVTFEKLLYGKYYVRETKAPKGYIQQENKMEIILDGQEYKIEVPNQKYEMPVTSDTDNIYYQSSLIFLILGMGAFYIVQKKF